MDGWDSISEKQRLCMRALLGLTFPPLQTANALNNNSNIPFDFESDAVYPTDWFPARRRPPSYCRWLFWNIGGSWRTRKVKQDSNQDLGLYSLFSSSFYCIHKTWNGLLLGLFMSTNVRLLRQLLHFICRLTCDTACSRQAPLMSCLVQQQVRSAALTYTVLTSPFFVLLYNV